MAEDLQQIPFGIVDAPLVDAYNSLPDPCKECPSVSEVLARVVMSGVRNQALGVPMLECHHQLLVADTSSDIDYVAVVSIKTACEGPKEPSEPSNSNRKDCPSQWLINAGSNGAHYGLDAQVIFNQFVESRKRNVGFQPQD